MSVIGPSAPDINLALKDFFPPGIAQWSENKFGPMSSSQTGEQLRFFRNTKTVRDSLNINPQRNGTTHIGREHEQVWNLNQQEFETSRGLRGLNPVVSGTGSEISANQGSTFLVEQTESKIIFGEEVSGAELRKVYKFVRSTDGQIPRIDIIGNSEATADARVKTPVLKKGWEVDVIITGTPNARSISTGPGSQHRVYIRDDSLMVEDYSTGKEVLRIKREDGGTKLDISKLQPEDADLFQQLSNASTILLGIDLTDRPGHIGSKIIDQSCRNLKAP